MNLNGVNISEAAVGDQPYFVITIDGEAFLQRREPTSATDSPLEKIEQVLVQVCEHLTNR